MPINYKNYLGDAVYADFDGWRVILTTENGISTSNTIVLEPEVFDALNRYVEMLKRRENMQDIPDAECDHLAISEI